MNGIFKILGYLTPSTIEKFIAVIIAVTAFLDVFKADPGAGKISV